MMFLLLLIHAAATWAMVGLIWMVQLVHYPLFNSVGSERFKEYHERHTRTITWIVAPLMFAELGTAAALLIGKVYNPWLMASFVLLAFNWLSTGLVQVPQHRLLGAGFDGDVCRRLVWSNWGRTVSWSLRGAMVLLVAYQLSDTN